MKPIVSASLVPFAVLASAQSRVAGSLTYDLGKREPLLNATYDVGVGVDDLFGSRLSLTLKPFVAATHSGDGLLGGVVTVRLDRLSRQFYGEIGFGGVWCLQSRPRALLYLGFGRKL